MMIDDQDSDHDLYKQIEDKYGKFEQESDQRFMTAINVPRTKTSSFKFPSVSSGLQHTDRQKNRHSINGFSNTQKTINIKDLLMDEANSEDERS